MPGARADQSECRESELGGAMKVAALLREQVLVPACSSRLPPYRYRMTAQ